MFDCVIIGAGASGLQCCARLIEHSDVDVDVVIVEARDRVGGRIYTRHETANVVTADVNGGSNNKVLFRRDLGASWVHGASDDNPMVKLLEECNTPALKSLDPIFEGNPWIRPNTVLHPNNGNDERARKSLISFFVNGSIVDDESPVSSTLISQALRRHYRCLEIITQNYGNEHNVRNLKNDEVSVLSPTSVDELSVDQVYKRLNSTLLDTNNDKLDKQTNDTSALIVAGAAHLDIMDAIDANKGEISDNNMEKNDTVTTNNNNSKLNEEDDKALVNLLASFYLFLIENWNGASMKDTNVEQLVELFLPEQQYNSDNEEVEGDEGSYEHEKEEVKKEREGNGVTIMDIDKHHDSAGDFFGPHCKVREGMITVLEPLIKIIERHQKDDDDDSIIRLKKEVISIVDKNNHVRIEMASGKIIEAKCCVCTLPLGCLQNLIAKTDKSFFQPRLCSDKINAINSIWSGSYRKVFLTFDHIFWPKEPPMIGLIRNKPRRRQQPTESSKSTASVLPGCHLLLNNLWARNDIPCIEAILCGNLGVWCFEKSNEIIQQAVIEFLEASMGLNDLSSSCIDFHVTRWEEDIYTRGAYSAFNLGTTNQHVDVIQSSEWDGRLLFAGEATELDHMGSVHGALMSGKRAAADVLGLLYR
jgi:hypothetical protein